MLKIGFAAFVATLGFAGSAAARPGAGLGEAYPQTCASGYHTDRGGNCQPDGGEQNRYCPAGLVFHPAFHGWYCEVAPPEAY